MKILIDIPEEFLEDFNKDRFEDSLMRLLNDAHLLAGRYEQEVATMLINSFKNGTPYEELEPSSCVLMEFGKCSYKETGCSDCAIKQRIRGALDKPNYGEGWMDGYNHAIDQIFKELNYLLKNHVLEELRKRIKR